MSVSCPIRGAVPFLWVWRVCTGFNLQLSAKVGAMGKMGESRDNRDDRDLRTIKMVTDKFPNGLIGLIGLNPNGLIGLIGLNPNGPIGLRTIRTLGRLGNLKNFREEYC